MMNLHDSSSNYNTVDNAKMDRFSTIFKQIVDSLPRLVCMSVAVWDYFHSRDIQRFLLLLAIGSTASLSLPKLKALAPKAATFAGIIAELLGRVK